MLGVLKTVSGLLPVILGLAGAAWFCWRMLRRSDDPAKVVFKLLLALGIVVGEVWFVHKCGGSFQEGGVVGNFGPALSISISIAVVGIVLSVIWTPQISAFLFRPLTDLFDGGSEPPEPRPLYSIAVAKRKRGLPLEAVVAIREQLARFPHDFEGLMLLAGVQAEDLRDLPGAELTLEHFCSAASAPPKQVAAAWTQLADWHLKLAADVDSARVAFEKIIVRFPGTELALQAEQRVAHLVGTGKILTVQRDRQNIAVPEGVKNIGLLDATEFLRPREIEPGKLAAAHVRHLGEHPHDSEVREKLAVIYARDFKRLDLAALELNQLIHEPQHGAKQIANWLNLLANFQIELGADVATVRGTLEQIVERFPNLPVAEIARRRLARVQVELNGKKAATGVKLGGYEQNLGLKSGRPGRGGQMQGEQ